MPETARNFRLAGRVVVELEMSENLDRVYGLTSTSQAHEFALDALRTDIETFIAGVTNYRITEDHLEVTQQLEDGDQGELFQVEAAGDKNQKSVGSK